MTLFKIFITSETTNLLSFQFQGDLDNLSETSTEENDGIADYSINKNDYMPIKDLLDTSRSFNVGKLQISKLFFTDKYTFINTILVSRFLDFSFFKT